MQLVNCCISLTVNKFFDTNENFSTFMHFINTCTNLPLNAMRIPHGSTPTEKHGGYQGYTTTRNGIKQLDRITLVGRCRLITPSETGALF